MKKSLLLTFLKVFFLLFLSLNLWASDIVCNSIVLRILESHKEKLNQTSENFFKNVIVKTLGLYGLENGKSVRSYEFNGHEILFPLIENEKRLKIVLNENILESGISETKDKKIIHLKIGESKTEAQNLLRQALVGSKMHPYISSTLSKVERSALGLSPIMHKDVQSEMLRSAKIAMNNGDKKFLTVGPTGIGKTEVFVGVFKERLKNLKFKNKLHVVVSDQINLSLQHEAELSNLKNETPFKIIRWGDDLKSFKIEDLLEEIKNDDRPVVLVTTIQSFKNRYFEADNETIINLQNKMATMFYDEAHHTGADGAQKVIKTLIDENPNEVFLLGATATPVHAKTSIQEIFGNKAFFAYLDSSVSYQKKGQTFREVSEVVKQLEIAIKKGELTPFDRTYFLTADQLQVAESEMFVQLESLRFVLNPNAYLTLFKKISPLISLHHHGMITAANISEAKRLEQFLNHAFSKNTNKNFRALHSELTKLEREQIKEDYKNGKINFLIAVDMMNEGVRFPGMSLYIDLNKNVSAREFLQRIGRVLALEQGKSGVDVVSLMSLSDDGMRENIELINSISKGQLSINRAIKSTVPSRRDLENEQMEYISLNRHEMQKQLVNLKLSMEEFWNNQETGYKNGKLVLDWMILNFEQTKKISLPMQRVDRDKASKLEYKMAQAIIRNFEKEDFLKAFKNKEEYVDYLKLMEFKIEKLKVNRMADISTAYLTGKSVLDWMILNFEQTKKISLPIQRVGQDEASKLEVKMAQAIINNFELEGFLKAFKEQAEYAEYLKLVEIRIAELEKFKKNQLTGNSHIYLRGKSVLDWMIENFERTKKISLPMQRVGRDKASKLEYNIATAIKTNFDKEDFLRPFQENPKYDDYLKLIEMKITEIKKFKENQQVGISQAYSKGKSVLDWMIENFERTKMMSLPIQRGGQDEASKLEYKMAQAIIRNFEKEDFLKAFKDKEEYVDYLKLMESKIETLKVNRMTDMSTSYLTGKSILDWMILNFEQTKKISLPIRKGGKDEASKLEVKMAQAIINNFYKEDFLKAFKEQAEYAEYLKLVEIRIAELEKVKKNQLTGNSHIYLRGKSVLDWMIENFERTKKISLPMLRVGRDKASKLEYNMAKAIKTNFDKEDFLRPFQENPKYDDYLKLIEMKITEIEKFKENQQVGISQDYLKGKRILDWMIENFERTKMMSLPIHRVGQDEASKLEAKMAIAIRTHFENEDFLKPFKENPEYADYLKLMESRIEKLRSNARIKDEN